MTDLEKELLVFIKQMNYAFYVEGTAKAMKPIMARSKELIHKAENSEVK